MAVRWLTPTLLVAVLVVPVSGRPAGEVPPVRPSTSAVANATEPDSPRQVAPAGSAARAVADARRAGHRVAVTAEQGEAHDVYAEPDGVLTAEFRTTPVRLRRGGGWVPVDTTLHRRGDGAVVPAATTRTVVFSRGGADPMVRLSQDGRQVAVSWPGALPSPELSGDTATYREVLPGVDLRLRATADGFSKVLVVRNRAAGMRLQTLRFGLATEGLTVRTDPNGVIRFVDPRGRQVFGTGAPLMWDAAQRKAVGSLKAIGDTLVLTPDRRLFTDPVTKYPVYVDPDFPAGGAGWNFVLSGFPDNTYWGGDGEGVAKVGKCPISLDSSCAANASHRDIGTGRGFFQFNTAAMLGKHILTAEFNTFESRAPSCSPRPVEAWGTAPVGPGTTWRNQPWWPGAGIWLGTANVAYGYTNCPGNWIGFNALGIVNWSVGNGVPTTTVMLKAENESDERGWKKFSAGLLTVHYNSIPNKPSLPTVEGKPCSGQPNEWYLNPYIDNDPDKGPRGPQLGGVITDVDGGNVLARFEWYTREHAFIGRADTVAKAAGSTFTADVHAAAATDGARLAYRVAGWDGTDWGPWSDYCDVTIDRSAPTKEPIVASGTYTECEPPDYDPCPISGGVGRTAAFTLGRDGDADIAGYRYDLHDQPSTYVAAKADGSASVLVTPTDEGPADLFVRGVDRAGNVGPMHRYHFFVGAATGPKGYWPLDGMDETDVRDSASGHHDGTVTMGPAGWRPGRLGDALWLNGGAGTAVTTGNGATLDTSKTFSVAAWAKLDRIGGSPAIVSQDGSQSPGFQLQATPDGHWAFVMFNQDVASGGTPHTRIVSGRGIVVGAWTHLVGVYDAGLGQMRLYVDGVLSAAAPKAPAWRATGAFTIGRSKWNNQPSDFWPGAIDEVKAWDRSLSVGEIHDLATTPAVEELFWPLDDEAGSITPDDASGNYRTGVFEGGPTWVTDVGQVGSGALRFDGADDSFRRSGPVLRTDNSFTVTARVYLDVADDRTQAIISQDGTSLSGFVLRYVGHKWSFGFAQSATDTTKLATTSSTDDAFDGEWTHLAAVYDASSKKIRLYVNGVLAGSETAVSTASWNATGVFRVGRSMSAGDFFRGMVDDVHAWTGARTKDEIQAEYLARPTARSTPYGGLQIARSWNNGHFHVVTTRPTPPGSHFEGPQGLLATDGAPGTVSVYSCRNGAADYFLSLQSECEGKSKLGRLGALYSSPPSGIPTLPLYRCLIPSQGHFTSQDPACEGTTTEFLLGYTRAYAQLLRSKSAADSDHITSVFRVPSHYTVEGRLGWIQSTWQAGTTALWLCRDGTDTFSSVQADCEGKTVVRWIGQIWINPPPGLPSKPLFRCRGDAGEHFDSTIVGCESRTTEQTLGYLINDL